MREVSRKKRVVFNSIANGIYQIVKKKRCGAAKVKEKKWVFVYFISFKVG